LQFLYHGGMGFGFAVLGLIISFAGTALAANGKVLTTVPKKVDPEQKYLFYLHGAWIERNELNKSHPKHGFYKYHDITQALANKGFVVISELRRGKSNAREYATHLSEQIIGLTEKGVPSRNITVVGHSRGGFMTLLTATMVADPGVNYVLLAGCGKEGSNFRKSYERFLMARASSLAGRILSLYDYNDAVAGTCQEFFGKSPLIQPREQVLRTGKGHGVFYSAAPEWVDKVAAWTQM